MAELNGESSSLAPSIDAGHRTRKDEHEEKKEEEKEEVNKSKKKKKKKKIHTKNQEQEDKIIKINSFSVLKRDRCCSINV